MAINGLLIETAPSVDELYAVLGQPSRVDTGERPAPVGHRNNHIHVYDESGLTLNEHHYTRRVQCLSCWFETDDPPYRFTPRQPFTGRLLLEDVEMPLGGKPGEFFAKSPIKFISEFGGIWTYKFDGFDVHVGTRGAKLRSGRRSKVLRITHVNVSWPHDNWGKPVTAGDRPFV